MTETVEIEYKGVGLESGVDEYEVVIPGGKSFEGSELIIPMKGIISQTMVDGVTIIDYESGTSFEVNREEGDKYTLLELVASTS